MHQRLTSAEAIAAAHASIAALLDARGEWFCTEQSARASTRRRDPSTQTSVERGDANAAQACVTSALRAGEWEVRAAHGSLFLSLLTTRGQRLWRVNAWEWTGERLLLSVTRRAGAESATLELIPRASAAAARAALEAARRALCQRMAALLCETDAHAEVERAALSRGARRGEPGRYARIVIVTRSQRIAATGPVADLHAHETDAFLSSALIWFARLGEKQRGPALRLRLVVPHNIAETIAGLVALLREELRRVVSLYEVDDGWERLAPVCVPRVETMLAAAPRFARPPETGLSDSARAIMAHAPEAIDVVRARRGETLRFHGLPFARVRRWMGSERVWFGVRSMTQRQSPAFAAHARADAPPMQLLDETNRTQFLKLLEELQAHRRAADANARHALYRAAPEAWLESLLRRDITRLDPGLRLSPLHAQFRTSRDAHAGARGGGGGRPVDLLALRQDGRLVVVELKVSEDDALPLQGADYWRRIYAHHRAGHIRRARLFGDAEISDESPLVYLVAPLLSFHRAFPTLARCISPQIEMYRFDLNEDWRAGVRVARRTQVV
jgi:hypothetical protein